MYKIGDFAKISQVSIHMLRHYDKIELFSPVHIDESTGYRYYSATQIPKLNRILVLKDLGFSLHQIRELLEKNLSTEELQGMLRLKESQIEQQIDEEHQRLMRVRARLRQISHEGEQPIHEVVMREIPENHYLSTGWITQPDEALSALVGEMLETLRPTGVLQGEELYVVIHAPPTRKLHHNVELGFVISENGPAEYQLPSGQLLKKRILPAEPAMATTVHSGPRCEVEYGYASLCSWIEAQQLDACGYFREVYLNGTESNTDPENIVELQIPVCTRD